MASTAARALRVRHRRPGAATVVDPAPVLAAVVARRACRVPAGVIGARFHRAVADMIVDLAGAEDPAPQTVALSGGVFQNALLLRLSQTALWPKALT